MHAYSKAIVLLGVLTSLLLLSNCKHDPLIAKGNSSDPDSLYAGRPYSFADNSAGIARYRKVKIPADNPQTYEGVQLGRMLFYDSTLSLNGRVSCGSCHKQQYSFGDNQRLSQNVHGSTKRNASTLINLGIDNIFFWDGRQASIEDAANDAFTNEQSPDINTAVRYLDTTSNYKYLFKKAFGRPATGDSLISKAKIVKALAQFIRTLRSENSKYDAYARGDAGATLTASEQNGFMIFNGQQLGDCAHCHVDAPYLTFSNMNPPIRNNALDTVADVRLFADIGYGKTTGNLSDYGKFKIPTLRNVEVSAPYMHDGRFTTLEQIADHYGTRDSLKRSPTIDPLMERFVQPIPDLDAQQKADLIAFLKTLTDTAFLNNPNFSNPFHH
jgi:cytochrome c peroxidase